MKSKTNNEHAPRLVAYVKEYALDNYERGWDIVVEAWDDAEILEAIGRSTTEKGAVKKVREILSPMIDYRNEIRAA